MEHSKDHLTLKAHTLNAILPKFLKHIFYNGLFFLFLYGVYLLVDYSANLDFDSQMILWLVGLTILFSFLKILKDLIIIRATEFNFYSTHVEYKFKFFREENHSINYSHITDIEVKKTLWDRVCGVGDIHIHTGNDSYDGVNTNDLVLNDIRNPDKVKSEILKKIHHN